MRLAPSFVTAVLLLSILTLSESTSCYRLTDKTSVLDDDGSAPATESVDWWMIWKAPSGGASFYLDNLLANGGDTLPVNKQIIDAFLTNHVRIIDRNNDDAIVTSNKFFTSLSPPKLPPPLYELHSTLKTMNKLEWYEDITPEVTSKLNTLAFYFNDQSDKAKGKISNFARVAKPEMESTWEDFSWKFAHSKSMLSVDMLDGLRYFAGTGFFLQHTMPNTPFAAVNAWKKNKKNFLPLKVEHDVDVKSQHIFCVSIKTSTVLQNVYEGLKLSRPQLMHANVDKIFLGQSTPALDAIRELLASSAGVELAKVCRDKWVGIRENTPWTDVMRSVPNECLKKIDLGNGLVMFAHSSLPHSKRLPDDEDETEEENTDINNNNNEINKNNKNKRKANDVEEDYDQKILDLDKKTAKKMSLDDLTILADYAVNKYQTKKQLKENNLWKIGRGNYVENSQKEKCIERIDSARKEIIKEREYTKPVHSPYFGPLHWDTVARQLGNPPVPLLVSCWKNTNLPSIFNVILVNDFLGTKHGQRHDKIAIAAVEPNQPDLHWSCFGDANHRTSEISHAGITICVKNTLLWTKLRTGVKSVYEYPASLKRDFPGYDDLITPLGFQTSDVVASISAQEYFWKIKQDQQLREVNNNNNQLIG